MFLPDSDLSPLKDNIDKIIDGLTRWQQVTKEKKREVPEKIIVEGSDYEEAMVRMNELFLENLWSEDCLCSPRPKRGLSGS